MNSSDSVSSRRRLPFYFFLALIAVALVLLVAFWMRSRSSGGDEFIRVMNVGKNYLDKGEAAKAIEAFSRAVNLAPTHPDARLNLANSFLLAGQPENALKEAQEVLNLDHNSAAAHYVKGCAHNRLAQWEQAVQALQESQKLDPSVGAVSFQLGLAHQQLKQWDEAITAFQTTIGLEPEHPAAHYNLSQVLIRAGRPDEANAELELHRQIQAKQPPAPATPATYERCKHTLARVPFQLEQPKSDGVKVQFVDATSTAFGQAPGAWRGPVGVIDIKQDGWNDLFVGEADGFRLLINTNGVFQPQGEKIPGRPEAQYTKCLVGDLQNDRNEDVLVLGTKGSHVFKFATNGFITDSTAFSRLGGLAAVDGVLADFDFTGKLDLVGVTSSNTLRSFRNLGNMAFSETTSTSGVPLNVTSARQIAMNDWNNDDFIDVLLAAQGQPPLLLLKQRGGRLVVTNFPSGLPNASAVTCGDLNNDLRNDLVLLSGNNKIEIHFQGVTESLSLSTRNAVREVALLDYDNDGWLDLIATGEGIQVWRNVGRAGFKEMSRELGLDMIKTGNIHGLATADFDNDGDSDLLLAVDNARLQLLRNDGGNANQQLKVRLIGNRSNSSGLGVRIEVTAGGLRTIRTVTQLPVEIGVGPHQQLDSVTVRWVDLEMPWLDVKVEPQTVFVAGEMTLPTGSCPYLYAWDRARFRFVTDLLGAAPMGLPLAEGKYIDADADEFVWVGTESNFQPRDGNYILQITEELREVLYLDEAKLFVVDHPPESEVHPTDKLLPRKPFPSPGELVAVHRRTPLVRAFRQDGADVTDLLVETDGKLVSPLQLRVPQLRGLAEPCSVTLDFGALQTDRPLMLAMTGWLRFGGGMANIAASQNPDLPFPFPTLEVESASGVWQPLDVSVGAPAGKTKTILVDLAGKLPAGSRRLRLSQAFEIHWDRIALFEKADARPRIASLSPTQADLHWRGFSEFQDLPWYLPLTPDYDRVSPNAKWRVTPSGWCTRYGPVDELVAQRDDALVLLNGGDELTLAFAADRLPPKPAGMVRNFFLFTVGWDKDADFHVAKGEFVEPLPFHGMDDQRYGQPQTPPRDPAWWIHKYNTRWVGPMTLKRSAANGAGE
ncbi:MAG: FG-GAP-like repeat-containing protein [Verrucomicrobiota bacterium]